METAPQYFVHNGYSGWSYGTPSNPHLISPEDATRIMSFAGLTPDQVALGSPAAMYAAEGDMLYRITGGNRFLFYGSLPSCMDVERENVASTLNIDWDAA